MEEKECIGNFGGEANLETVTWDIEKEMTE
jgi:hypothetical protein